MIPGRIARLSEETQASATAIGPVKSDIVKITGTTQIDTIAPAPAGGYTWGQLIILIPVDGSVILGTGGNILVGITAVINRAVFLTWVVSLQKWVINSGV
jgi:hypothetical protein